MDDEINPTVLVIPNYLVKRVPMGFDWPINKVWEGYLGSEPIDPPTGEGWQLWETTTKGSPHSPVFETLEQVAEWAEVHVTIWGDIKASKNDWLELLQSDPLSDA
jgi:hypothetical protein